jgi:hypothetical protein
VKYLRVQGQMVKLELCVDCCKHYQPLDSFPLSQQFPVCPQCMEYRVKTGQGARALVREFAGTRRSA